jgi:glycosyltransferase involved in cell wall biosynthesis/FMN phosphatase YigB (HAD superfamily)
MNNFPLVSVIVRSMERSSLGATLASIAGQTYPNIEVLVVNAKGGGHVEIGYCCAPFVSHLLNRDGLPMGRSRAANAGLDAISGKYFAFLDDDDTIDPEHFSQLIDLADQETESTVVYAGIRSVDGNNPAAGILNIYAEAHEKGKLLAGNFIPIHAPLVPSRLLEHGLRFDESLDVYEDWDFWLQVERYAKLLFSGSVSGTYTINGSSGANPLTVSYDTMRQATLLLYSKWLPRLSPEYLWHMSRLYHQRNLRLHHISLEHEALKREAGSANERLKQLDGLLQQMAALHARLQSTDQEVVSLGQQLSQVRAEQETTQRHLDEATAMLDIIHRSHSWALTAPLRNFGRMCRSLQSKFKDPKVKLAEYANLLRFVRHAVSHNGGLLRSMRKAWAILRLEGRGGIMRRLPFNRMAIFEAASFRHNLFHASDLIAGQAHELAAPQGIAVMVHVYYPDLFEQIADALGNMPWTYDLYISVTTQEAKEAIHARAAALPRIGELDIRIVPNRGRDIAPFLVEFRDELQQHRYVLHLHTKKSLYSGRERQEWRNYLTEGLLGSEQRIRHIFEMFARNKTVGIIYPDTFEGVPYWAHSWLHNRGIALTLAMRLGIDIRHRNYVDAPMGSMFWARTEALQALFDLNLGYGDFPEEQGQTDGTLQHTIERFFVLAANRNGYTQRVMLTVENEATLFLSPGRKNLAHYFSATVQHKIGATGACAAIISFDIFDTLLIRPWISPGNLFAFMEDIVFARHGLSGFAASRQEAERLARMGQASGDVGIEAIYHSFAALCGNAALANKIRELEESLECRLLMPRPDVCAAARQLKESGKRIVLASDMYLSKDFLQDTLRAKQVDFYDALYVSSDLGLRKDRGDMWPEISKRENTPAEKWQHVGDNEHSDLQIPLDAGYPHPVHVMRSADLFMLFNEDAGNWIRPDIWQEGLHLGLLANRFFIPGLSTAPISQDVQERSIEINSLQDFGYAAFGPALASFMAWLIREARNDGINQLLYASREGHLLKQAHDLISRHIQIPAGEYFLCSRRAAVFASIREPASIDTMLGAHFKGSFGDFLRMRLGIEDLAPYRARLGDERCDTPGELPEQTEAYRQNLLACGDLLEKAASLERVAYENHARQIIGDQRAALVDIGYSGTIQRALNRFLSNIAGGYYFVTVEKAAEIERDGHFAKGCFGHHINAFHSDIPLYQFSLLSEAILTAPHGQLIRFEAHGTDTTPRFKAPGLAQEHFADIDQMHQGALQYLSDVLDVTGEHFELLAGHNQTANLAIRQIMEYRWKLGFDTPALHVEDNYSGNHEISIFEFYDEKRKRLPGTLVT